MTSIQSTWLLLIGISSLRKWHFYALSKPSSGRHSLSLEVASAKQITSTAQQQLHNSAQINPVTSKPMKRARQRQEIQVVKFGTGLCFAGLNVPFGDYGVAILTEQCLRFQQSMCLIGKENSPIPYVILSGQLLFEQQVLLNIKDTNVFYPNR